MKTFLLAIALLLAPSVSRASVLGFLFGTDDPDVEIARIQMRHDRDMAKRSYRHERSMARHDRSMARRSYSVSGRQRYSIRYYSVPSRQVYVERLGSVIFHYVR